MAIQPVGMLVDPRIDITTKNRDELYAAGFLDCGVPEYDLGIIGLYNDAAERFSAQFTEYVAEDEAYETELDYYEQHRKL